MKNIKKILAAALALVMLLSFAGCHPKDEIAVTIGDVEFTSAYYMCALMAADSEAQSEIYETLSEEEQQSTDIDYESKEIDGKDFVTWVEDRAIESLKEIAAYKILCKENGLELSDEQIEAAEYYASYYWNDYGYSTMFEPNGVGEATYTQYMKDTYYSSLYFDFLYGAEGSKAIAGDEVKTKIYDNYVLANVLTGSYESGMTEEQIAEVDAKMQGYYDALVNGTRTFKDIYIEYNEISEEDLKAAEESEEDKPLDLFAGLIGSEETGESTSSYYDTVKAMAVGEVKLIDPEDGSGMVIIVKQDIESDPYYLTSLDSAARHLIKDEEYEADMKAYAKELKAEVNDYALKQFQVKDIIEPSYE